MNRLYYANLLREAVEKKAREDAEKMIRRGKSVLHGL
jgi:hypothetical protein